MFDSATDWLIIAVVVGILLFGATKIPTLAHSLGRSLGEFKRGRLEVDREISQERTKGAAPAASPTEPTR